MSQYNYRYSPNPIVDVGLLGLLNTESSYNLVGIKEGEKLENNNFFYIEIEDEVIGCIWFDHNPVENEIEISFGKLSKNDINKGMLSNILDDLNLLLTKLPTEWTDQSLKPKWLITIQHNNIYSEHISLMMKKYSFILDLGGGYLKSIYSV